MNAYDGYRLYLALKLHFTTQKYDIRKTKGAVKTTVAMFKKKPKVEYEIKRILGKYPQQKNFINYFVANFITGDKWGGMYNPQAEDIYLEWQGRIDRLGYDYKNQLVEMQFSTEKLENLWKVADHKHPPILQHVFGKTCSLETLVVLEKLFRFRSMVDDKLPNDPVWGEMSHTINKYSPFIKIDKEKFTMITEQVFNA